MNTAKHTPGPWRLQVNRVKDYVSVFPIQVCIEESPLSDETIANAHLIAAAPAMYEALQTLVEYLSAQVPADTLDDWKHVLVARQALAQAEGK